MRKILFLAFLLLSFESKAQQSTQISIPFQNMPYSYSDIITIDSFANRDALLEQDSIYLSTADTNTLKPYIFAISAFPNTPIDGSTEWDYSVPGFKRAKVKFQSVNALGLAVELRQFYLPENTSLYIYNEEGFVTGPFTSVENKQDSIFISPFLKGDNLTLEFIAPEDKDIDIVVSDVVHCYRSVPTQTTETDPYFEEPLPCNQNINCALYDPFCDEKRAVCLIIIPFMHQWENCLRREVRKLWSAGSGALINNSLNDQTPYIYSARHVFYTQLYYYWCTILYETRDGFKNLNEAVFYFNNQSNNCFSNNLYSSAVWNQYVRGCYLMESAPGTPFGPDQILVKMYDKPNLLWNPYYAGWSREVLDALPGYDVTGIHHPKAAIKKGSKGQLHYSLLFSNYWGVEWNHGITQNGSSGSPLFIDGSKKIIGSLSWGPAQNDECGETRQYRYGRLLEFWGKISRFISPDNVNRATCEGLDPATMCQETIEVNGEANNLFNIFPRQIYDESQIQFLIQASKQILVSNRSALKIINQYPYQNKLTFRAGEAIEIVPTGNSEFIAEEGTFVEMSIQDCAPTTTCAFNNAPERPLEATASRPATPLNRNEPLADPSSSLKLIPNPASTQVTVEFYTEIPEPVQVSIVNIMGGKVVDISRYVVQGLNKFVFDLREMHSGTYFVKVQSSSASKLGKLSIVK